MTIDEFLAKHEFWISKDRADCFYRGWMVNAEEKFDIPGYITDAYSSSEACLEGLRKRYGKEIVEKMKIRHVSECNQ